MSVQTIRMGRQKFVVIPEREFRRLQKKAQDKGDIAEAKRREREPSVPLGSVRRGSRLVSAMRGRATRKMSTDQIMALTRGE